MTVVKATEWMEEPLLKAPIVSFPALHESKGQSLAHTSYTQDEASSWIFTPATIFPRSRAITIYLYLALYIYTSVYLLLASVGQM